MTFVIDSAIVALIFTAIHRFRSPRSALAGNAIAAAALVAAIVAVVVRHDIQAPAFVIAVVLLGAMLGWLVSARVSMIQTPALVAFQHGLGALGALLVCAIELLRATDVSVTATVSGFSGLTLGAATLTGSMLAAAKLSNRMSQATRVLPNHNGLLAGVGAAIVAIAAASGTGMLGNGAATPVALAVLAGAGGWLVAMRIGGADMPVLISSLNATAGLSASFAGIVIGSQLLVAAGAMVAASGSVLTVAMCKAMNRRLATVFAGTATRRTEPQQEPSAAEEIAVESAAVVSRDGGADPLQAAVEACLAAHSVILVPGYGMALAQAQHEVAGLAEALAALGKAVMFAIHPVAGRMPGHMHVLLSEANVSWDSLRELDINPSFKDTDLCIVVGASDVVNPAAALLDDTPISGMPILTAHEARRVLMITLDDKPGYSGVRNQLYDLAHTLVLWGDAKDSLRRLLNELASSGVASISEA